MPRLIVIGIRTQRSWYPNSAPTEAKVAMPPASFPALAVIIPGPRIARYGRIRFHGATLRTPRAPRRIKRRPAARTAARGSCIWRVSVFHEKRVRYALACRDSTNEALTINEPSIDFGARLVVSRQ